MRTSTTGVGVVTTGSVVFEVFSREISSVLDLTETVLSVTPTLWYSIIFSSCLHSLHIGDSIGFGAISDTNIVFVGSSKVVFSISTLLLTSTLTTPLFISSCA